MPTFDAVLVQTLISGLVPGAIYGVLGMGIVVTYKCTRVLNLAHGGVAMFVAFFALSLLENNWPYGVAMLAAAAVAVALGISIDFCIMRPLRNRNPLDSAIASLGLLLTLQGLAVIMWGSQQKVFPSPVPRGEVEVVSGLRLTYHQLFVFFCVAAVSALMAFLFKKTKTGLAIRAYVENPQSARSLGVSPFFISAVSWGVGALLAGLAGVLLAPITLLDTLRMPLFAVKALVAALCGGLVSLPGALLGGLLLGVTEAYFLGYVQLDNGSDYLPFALVLIVLLYQGVLKTGGTTARTA